MLSRCEKNSRTHKKIHNQRIRYQRFWNPGPGVNTARLFFQLSLLLFGAAVNLSAPIVAKEQPPNVIFILTDDQGAWALGSYGNPEIRTPNLDALAAGGARFTNAFVSTPAATRMGRMNSTTSKTIPKRKRIW